MDIKLNKQLGCSESWKKHKDTIREKAAVQMLGHSPVRLNPHFIPRVTKIANHDISVFSTLFSDGSPFI
jgi:hypothetical protein